MLENDFFKEVNNFIFNLLKNELSPRVVYHNYNHTLKVVEAVNEIALAEKVSNEDLEILLLAAWFHDTGFTKGAPNHEKESQKIAQKYLFKKGLDEEKIAKVLSIIEATRMPQKPTSKLEKIICDADLFHLGTENFSENANLLRSEWEQFCDKHLTEIEWLKENNRFYGEHTYFTNYTFNKLGSQKASNWLKIQKDLRKSIAKEEEFTKKNKLKKDEIKRKKAKDDRPDRGIETMYRVTLKNHIKLSDIADTKANILLSVSAIILSIALSTLFPKLDKPDNYYLIYPTMLFLFVSVVTMIFSILSTRPKVTSGTFTKKDVEDRKVNLLFFGNFHKMPLEEFQTGMTELMNDRDYLYKSLMKDLYFLGIVLDKKYRLLRIAYNIFMVGIIASVVTFIIAFQLMKNSGI
ncbi:MAG: HD domain-containing protein [Lutibacter sp.]|uniref:Pycsar system effector family protein n=1 Tax=Lutibacter sp. TaxID=1925666 RepID=UPI0019F10C82|nr:Pycsar system effector family protein [Lutibacter sp.]NOR28379.1 HD domain-containing protein [Lutibacter sp.]